MNKADLIAKVASQTGLSRKDSQSAVEAVFDSITQALVEGETFQYAGFGSFEAKKRAARQGRNPMTKETIEIPATVVPAFKAGKGLKDAVAQK